MPTFSVEMICKCHAFLEIEADDEDDAIAQANERGVELIDITEIDESDARRAEEV